MKSREQAGARPRVAHATTGPSSANRPWAPLSQTRMRTIGPVFPLRDDYGAGSMLHYTDRVGPTEKACQEVGVLDARPRSPGHTCPRSASSIISLEACPIRILVCTSTPSQELAGVLQRDLGLWPGRRTLDDTQSTVAGSFARRAMCAPKASATSSCGAPWVVSRIFIVPPFPSCWALAGLAATPAFMDQTNIRRIGTRKMQTMKMARLRFFAGDPLHEGKHRVLETVVGQGKDQEADAEQRLTITTRTIVNASGFLSSTAARRVSTNVVMLAPMM